MDRFFGFIQSHWGKAGCTHCGKEYTSAPLFICSCHYAMYCGVECQRQHWMEHALICGKGDKREAGEELKDERKLKKEKEDLPRMEQKVPKDILNLLVPFMRGQDLINFSEATQAGMVAYREYVAKKVTFRPAHLFGPNIPLNTLLSLSPWVAKLDVTGLSSHGIRVFLTDWPAKHLIQTLRMGIEAVQELSNFHNLKHLYLEGSITACNTVLQTFPDTLEKIKLHGFFDDQDNHLGDFSKFRHLRKLYLWSDGAVEVVPELTLPGPLEKLFLHRLSVTFTKQVPIAHINITRAYNHPLLGCNRLTVAYNAGYESVIEQLGNIRRLKILDVQEIDLRIPPSVEHLKLLNCNNVQIRYPPRLRVLSLEFVGAFFENNLPENQLERVVLTRVDYRGDNFGVFNRAQFNKCRNVTISNWITTRTNIVSLLNPPIVTHLLLHSSNFNTLYIDDLSAYTSLEELTLSGTEVQVNDRGKWVIPETLRVLDIEYADMRTPIEKLPDYIERVRIHTTVKDSPLFYFLEKNPPKSYVKLQLETGYFVYKDGKWIRKPVSSF